MIKKYCFKRFGVLKIKKKKSVVFDSGLILKQGLEFTI